MFLDASSSDSQQRTIARPQQPPNCAPKVQISTAADWNPQNDLQAMARCHRIGQEKEVSFRGIAVTTPCSSLSGSSGIPVATRSTDSCNSQPATAAAALAFICRPFSLNRSPGSAMLLFVPAHPALVSVSPAHPPLFLLLLPTPHLCLLLLPAPPQVTIYRLVSKNTYEQNVFEISSRKYGAWLVGTLVGSGRVGWHLTPSRCDRQRHADAHDGQMRQSVPDSSSRIVSFCRPGRGHPGQPGGSPGPQSWLIYILSLTAGMRLLPLQAWTRPSWATWATRAAVSGWGGAS